MSSRASGPCSPRLVDDPYPCCCPSGGKSWSATQRDNSGVVLTLLIVPEKSALRCRELEGDVLNCQFYNFETLWAMALLEFQLLFLLFCIICDI